MTENVQTTSKEIADGAALDPVDDEDFAVIEEGGSGASSQDVTVDQESMPAEVGAAKNDSKKKIASHRKAELQKKVSCPC